MKTTVLKRISALVPYVAVLIGLFFLHNAWIAIGLYHFGIIVFLIAGETKGLLKKVCIGWNSTAAALGMVMSVMIFPIIFFLWRLMQLESVSLNSALTNLRLHGASWFFFMIYFSTVQPFLEELYWRGYLACNHKYFSWTDFAFAGYHVLVLAWFIKLPWLVIAFILLTIVASIWRFLASKYQGLVIPLLSHMAADISIIIAIYALIQ